MNESFLVLFYKKEQKALLLRKEAKTFDQWMGRRCVPKRRPIVFFSEGLPHHRKRPGSQGRVAAGNPIPSRL
jgi:hypothetical protein